MKKNKFWTVALYTYIKNVKSIAFVIMLLLPLVIGLIVYGVANVVKDNFKNTDKIALVTKSEEIQTAFGQIKGDVTYKVMDEKKAMTALKDEKVGAILLIDEQNSLLKSELRSTKSVSELTQYAIQQSLTSIQQLLNAQKLKLSQEQMATVLMPAVLEDKHIEFDENGKVTTTEDYSGIRQIVTYALIIIIYTFVVTYSSIIAQEIANEKGTRIMEIILSSVKAEVHFYGKLVGIMLVCATNVLVYAVYGIIGYKVASSNESITGMIKDFHLDKAFSGQFWFVIPILILGILLYSFLAALSGSLISRVEDVAKAQTPIMLVGISAYAFSMVFQTMPDNILVYITTYIPFVSSYTLPLQLSANVATAQQVFISMGIMVATMIFLLLFSAKLYKSNVLIYNDGGLLKTLKQSIKNVKADR
ncbi:ABC-2 type transport system permease protein [Pilibacter termitis]|uniref:ABC-2 type transport system permease protein n=1 Tax=Pilibacter termitis TaxID=263852 RepID=A0A1T4R817_9ENTE|nr:ABC transporter permease [Pilibacter termitis]SKA12192.1 ABC-2 type transport system permease protein [Pilibacter termitis]